MGHVRVSDAAERRSASNAGSASVARAYIECSARQVMVLKDGLCANEYIRIVSDVTSSVRCKALVRLATHVPAFAGAVAECSRVRYGRS